jgi:ariadne-1
MSPGAGWGNAGEGMEDGGGGGWSDCDDEDGWAAETDDVGVAGQSGASTMPRTQSFTLLDAAAIEARHAAQVETLLDELYVSEPEADCLLRAYHFDLNRLRNEWFATDDSQDEIRLACNVSKPLDADGNPVPAASTKGKKSSSSSASASASSSSLPKNNDGKCQMLFCDTDPATAAGAVTALNCGHRYCAECWTAYLQAQVNIGRDCLYAVCPGFTCEKKGCTHQARKGCKCEQLLPRSLFAAHVHDASLLEKYKQWMRAEFVDNR